MSSAPCGADPLVPPPPEIDVEPRTATTGAALAPRLKHAGFHDETGAAADLPRADLALLLRLQRRALRYFLDNQTPDGLILDRQRNHGPRRDCGLRSTAATGMGLIALAL